MIIKQKVDYMTMREINVDTLALTLTRRGRHERDRLVTLKRGNQDIYLKKKIHAGLSASSNPGCMHDRRGSQAFYQSATSPSRI